MARVFQVAEIGAMYLIEILLPLRDNHGNPFGREKLASVHPSAGHREAAA